MSAVSNVTCQVQFGLPGSYTPANVLSNYQIPGNIAIASTAGNLQNGNGAPLLIDLAAWGIVTLASTTQTINFTSLVDPGGVTQNWTTGPGRVRVFAVQVLTTTAGFDLEVYAAASNPVAWLPPVANTLFARANGGTLAILDLNSNGSGVGNVVGSTACELTFNSGAHTVQFAWMALGASVQ